MSSRPSIRPDARAAWRRPFVLIGATLAAALLLDLRYNPADAGWLSFTLAEVAAWGSLILIALIRKPRSIVEWLAVQPFAANRFAMLWVLWAVAASLVGALLLGRWEGLQLAKDMMPGFIAFLFLSGLDPSGQEWRLVRTALLAALAALGALGISQYLFGGPYFVTAADVGFQKVNLDGNFVSSPVTGLSQHPNNFGQLLAPALAFALVLLIRQPLRFHPLLWAAVLLGGLCLYATAMKGGMFWITVGIALALLPRRLISGHAAMAVLVLVGLGLVEYSLSQRNDVAGSMQTRLYLWQTALDNLRQPIDLMIGGDVQEVAADNYAKLSWNFPHSHMTYLNNALYFGVPALILYCAALYRGMLGAARVAARANAPTGDGYGRAVLAALVTSAGIGLLESTAEPGRFGIVFVMLGLAGALARSVPAAERRPPARPARGLLARSVVGR